ncbi:MAG: hypothetical protein RML72_11695, partial [Bacteroidia bacterium]|nr:hypothetical protein [Bacteroidia bacterium]
LQAIQSELLYKYSQQLEQNRQWLQQQKKQRQELVEIKRMWNFYQLQWQLLEKLRAEHQRNYNAFLKKIKNLESSKI